MSLSPNDMNFAAVPDSDFYIVRNVESLNNAGKHWYRTRYASNHEPVNVFDRPTIDFPLLACFNPGMSDGFVYASYLPVNSSLAVSLQLEQDSDLTFGAAIEQLLAGKCLARVGWNGKGMYVFRRPTGLYGPLTLNEHFLIHNANATFSTWVPSVNDCLAQDWHAVKGDGLGPQDAISDQSDELA